MKSINPYPLSHVILTLLGVYSLALGWVFAWRKGRGRPDAGISVVLGAVWLAFLGLFLYVRIAGHTF